MVSVFKTEPTNQFGCLFRQHCRTLVCVRARCGPGGGCAEHLLFARKFVNPRATSVISCMQSKPSAGTFSIAAKDGPSLNFALPLLAEAYTAALDSHCRGHTSTVRVRCSDHPRSTQNSTHFNPTHTYTYPRHSPLCCHTQTAQHIYPARPSASERDTDRRTTCMHACKDGQTDTQRSPRLQHLPTYQQLPRHVDRRLDTPLATVTRRWRQHHTHTHTLCVHCCTQRTTALTHSLTHTHSLTLTRQLQITVPLQTVVNKYTHLA